uniref:Uncharacterized protein n=1 Tax=Ursus americanus TaxID=9643 RepID=A0A452RCC9_URSAM
MAACLASDMALLHPRGGDGRGDGWGRAEPYWVNPQIWLNILVGQELGQGLGEVLRCGGFHHASPPYEFCRGTAYCGPQVGVQQVPQGSLETSQGEGELGANPLIPPPTPAPPRLFWLLGVP